MTDGAVLPILHLNGYKTANPTILARIGAHELQSLFIGYSYKVHSTLFDGGMRPPTEEIGGDPALMENASPASAAARSNAQARPITLATNARMSVGLIGKGEAWFPHEHERLLAKLPKYAFGPL